MGVCCLVAVQAGGKALHHATACVPAYDGDDPPPANRLWHAKVGLIETSSALPIPLKPDRAPYATLRFKIFTLTLQKSRMPQIQGVKDEAVVAYRESLTTQEMRYYRLFRRVRNMAFLGRCEISL